MAWVKIDDQFPDHPKILRIPAEAKPEALALQVLALCYSSRYLTDGKLPQHVVRVLLTGFQRAEELPKLMVDAGLWEHGEQEEGDYVIHDYLEYNPSKKQVLSLRRKRQASGKQGGMASAKQRASKPQVVAQPLLNPRPVPSPTRPVPSQSPSPGGEAPLSPHATAEDLKDVWNRHVAASQRNGLPGLIACQELSRTRKTKSALRLKEHPVAWHEEAIRKLAVSPFACGGVPGKDGKPWRASFEWYVANEDNGLKALEGKYDDVRARQQSLSERLWEEGQRLKEQEARDERG